MRGESVWRLLALALALAASGAARAVTTEPSGWDRRLEEVPRVASIKLVAPPGIDLTGLESQLMIRSGQPYSEERVRRTLELLYEAGRFSNVLVYERPTAEGVELLFKLVPRQLLTGVGFHGNARFSDEELRKRSGLEPGEEFFPERLHTAILALDEGYRRAGYPRARLSSEVSTNATRASVEIEVEEGEPERLRELSVSGKLGLPRPEVLALLGLRPGQILDQDRLEAAVQELGRTYRSRGYYRSRVGPARIQSHGSNESDVRLPIDSGPRIDFAFVGNLGFSAARLRRVLEYSGEERLGAALLARLVGRLQEFFVRQGFFEVGIRVQPSTHPGGLTETFVIEEGRPLRVAELEVRGAHHFTAEELRAQVLGIVSAGARVALFGAVDSAQVDAIGVSGRPGEPEPGRFQPDRQVYDPALYSQAVGELALRYREEGFLGVEVPLPSVDLDEVSRKARVLLTVREGVQTRLSELRFDGLHQIPRAAAREAVALPLGAPYSQSTIDRGRQALQSVYGHRGFPFARVDAQEEVTPGDPAGAVVFRIDEGPLVRVGQVRIEGARDTHPGIIDAALTVAPGQILDPDALVHTQQRLLALGVFDSVQVAMIDPEVPAEVKDLRVILHERKPQGVVVGGGYSIIEGPRAFIEYTHGNLFGRGLKFQSELKLNYFPWSYLALSGPSGPLILEGLPPQQALAGKDNFFGFGGRLNATLNDPRAFNLGSVEGSARAETLLERIDRPYYAFSRGAVVPGIDLRFGRRVTLSLQVSGEWDQILTYWENLNQIYQYLSFADLQNLRIPDGEGLLATAGPTLSVDLRDDPVNPHHGFFASAKTTAVGGAFFPSGQGGETLTLGATCANPGQTCPVELVSAQGMVAGYVPIGRSWTLALSAQGGRIFSVGSSFVIPTQRFFLGGPDTDRGFQQDMMLPQDVREALHRDVRLCGQTASGVSCSTAAQILRTPGNQLPSPGGEVFDNLRGELRFPLYQSSVDGAIFVDAGNLWSDATQFDPLILRPAAGVGVRVPSPIGPAALDLGFNLSPDLLVNETIVQVHLAIGLF